MIRRPPKATLFPCTSLFRSLGRAIAMPPTLVVHDRDDAYTPVADGAAIAAAWPDARLRVTSGLGHRRILRDPEVVAEAVEFVDRKSTRLNSSHANITYAVLC